MGADPASPVSASSSTPEDDVAATTVDVNHPRPQLRREEWEDLSGPWGFAFDDGLQGIPGRWHEREDVFDRVIQVPFPFESPASGVHDTGFHPVVWYRREFTATARPEQRLLLHFGAVDYRAHVWVNGASVAYHEGGNTPFAADITSVLDDSGTQVVVVRAEDSPSDLRQPRGKQDWQPEPHAIWYDRTSGIWQPVWLEHVPEARVRSLRWSTDADGRGVDLVVKVRKDAKNDLRLRVVLTQRGRVLGDDTYAVTDGELQRRITFAEHDMSLGHSDLLWSPEHPNLIDAVITLLDGEEVLDRVYSYTAVRSVSASRDRLLLNGRPYFLRLVLAQGFWPQSHLAAPDADALRREVQMIKDLGFNGVRLHQKVEDPRFLAWCDRLGLVVWAEMPAAYQFSTTTIERLTREWLEVLERDLSHPCIIAWVPVNESWGVPALERSRPQEDLVRALYHLTKAMDPDRLVIGNDGWEQPVTDVVTVHDYASRGSVLRDRYGDWARLEHTLERIQPGYRVLLLGGAARDDRPVLISEFGGITLDADNNGGWRGYGEVRSADGLLEGYRDLVTALLDSAAVVGFCWTQLTDTQQERNGLLTAERTPKVPVGAIRAITQRVAAAVPGDAIDEFAYGDYAPGSPQDLDGPSSTGSG
ncbi:sugar-binding domain-containing protein [Cellulomonas sp. URHD0024]|uniref:sugar-binding domain-containing protein n=1 Tax=Cellulomonas sp. URHD0024 TaxID=1302620 RepID=UPI00041FF72F|nr:sugar-binding domain-containing protein [Cellulomonas sp. URHD0024]